MATKTPKPQTASKGSFELSKESVEYVEKELKRYEDPHSAIIPALYRAQEENGGWISQDVIEHLAKVTELPIARIMEVFSFYTMFNKEPVGKFHLQVCCNISCAMAGGREIVQHMCKKLGVGVDEMTKDGKFTVSKVECLGSCGTAPMMQVNEKYYEDLSKDQVDRILQELR